ACTVAPGQKPAILQRMRPAPPCCTPRRGPCPEPSAAATGYHWRLRNPAFSPSRRQDFDVAINQQQRDRIASGKGFIAALDQSGGSTPKALGLYGIEPSAWSS